MPQDMVNIPNCPRKVLLKMSHKFKTGYQLLAHSSAYARCRLVLSLALQRSRP
jgi:hypothetical protein